jgi:hypothetical protein
MDGVHGNIEINLLDSEEQRAKAVEELSSCLRPMTHHLPAHYRDAISLVELEGLTQREAVERLGLSVSGMKSRVQRGRQMLKRLLHECCQIHAWQNPSRNLVAPMVVASVIGAFIRGIHAKDDGHRTIANPVVVTY